MSDAWVRLCMSKKSEGTTLSRSDSNRLTKKLNDNNCLSEIWSHEVQPQWNISSRSNHGILNLLHVYNIDQHALQELRGLITGFLSLEWS